MTRLWLDLPPAQWEADPPGTQLVLQVVAITPGERPGWRTVSGWRHVEGELAPSFVRVQVREDALPESAR